MRKGQKAWNRGISMAKYPWGMYQSTTYISWNNMKTRCKGLGNLKNKRNYLDRGITYDKDWEVFDNFLKDMGERPFGMTLDRINNSLGYSKNNCRWASYSEQNRNRRTMSNTGHKHITKWENYFIVSVRPFRHFRTKTIEEALGKKKELLDIIKSKIKFKENTMQVDQITYTKRHNEGDYSYSEYSLIASLEEGDDVFDCYNSLKSVVSSVISGKRPVEEVQVVKEDPSHKQEVEESVTEPVKKKKETKAKKEKAPVSQETSTTVVEEPKKKEKLITYDSNIQEHKSILGGFLTKKYENAWKTVKPAEEIKAFTLSLNGKDFLDLSGNIVPSFIDSIVGFFGA